MSQAEVKLAVVGAGVIGKRHIDAIERARGATLAALVDVDEAAQAVAADAGVPCFDSVDALMGAAPVDGVVVATPTVHHLDPVLTALDAGAHAFVEKPVTATLDEAQLIVDRAATTGRHVLVGHQRRYYALVEKTREIIRTGRLGKLVAVNGQWTVRKNDEYYEPDWRKVRAAGPVLTNLIHEIDYLRYMCGEIVSVTAELSNAVLGFEKEDAAACVLRFESGALGTFILSDQASSPWSWELATGENWHFPASHQNAIRFMGTDASLDFPNLTLWHHGGGTPSWEHLAREQKIEQPFEDAYVLQCEHFVRVINGNEKPRINAADGMKTLAATLAVFDSAKDGARQLL